jgi:NACalpha-BTF3-like transcription factor
MRKRLWTLGIIILFNIINNDFYNLTKIKMKATNQMFSNETIFKTIEEMVKQYENIKDEDEFREKCIDLVYNTFNVDKYQAEVLFDMAIYNE